MLEDIEGAGDDEAFDFDALEVDEEVTEVIYSLFVRFFVQFARKVSDKAFIDVRNCLLAEEEGWQEEEGRCCDRSSCEEEEESGLELS